MSDRPSDGMMLDELQDEFDWMFEFQSRMAERIRGDADVHNLADYVSKLEAENAKLRDALKALMVGTYAELCSDRDAPQCRECSMRRDECECAITEAMELLGLFADGTPVGTVDERGRNRVTGKRDQ